MAAMPMRKLDQEHTPETRNGHSDLRVVGTKRQLPPPGRRLSGEEANDRLLTKNAELYDRLAQ